MSILLAPGIVVRGPTFTLPGGSGDTGNDPVTVFTVPADVSALIESVYMVVEYNAISNWGDTFVLRLRDQSGLALMAQPSSIQMATNVAAFELTWMRRGNDTAIGGEFTWSFEMGELNRSWFTGALPDVVLAPGSRIEMQAYRGQANDPTPALLIDQVAITYTPAGGSSDLTTVQGIPLLTPADNG